MKNKDAKSIVLRYLENNFMEAQVPRKSLRAMKILTKWYIFSYNVITSK